MCKGCQQPYKVAVIRKDGDTMTKGFDEYSTAAGCYNANKDEPSVYLMGHCMDNHSWVTLAHHST